MNYTIKRAVHHNAKGIIEAHRRSIREVCSKDYNTEQIAAWSGRDFREDRWCQTMDRDFVWVVTDTTEKIFGFGHLKIRENSEAEIAGLYFVPELIGVGLGKNLVRIMFDVCGSKAISKVVLSATKTAQSFYQSCGFVQIGGTSSIQIGGQIIECLNMEKSLP